MKNRIISLVSYHDKISNSYCIFFFFYHCCHLIVFFVFYCFENLISNRCVAVWTTGWPLFFSCDNTCWLVWQCLNTFSDCMQWLVCEKNVCAFECDFAGRSCLSHKTLFYELLRRLCFCCLHQIKVDAMTYETFFLLVFDIENRGWEWRKMNGIICDPSTNKNVCAPFQKDSINIILTFFFVVFVPFMLQY